MEVPSPWPLLHRVGEFSLRVVARGEDGTPVQQLGAGRVRVEFGDPGAGATIVWREEGRWGSGPLAGTAFHNATAWRRLPGSPALELSHLRRGDNRPTFLVRLEPTLASSWASREPHRCGADRYRATLDWDARRLRLCWDVESPTDPYQLVLEAGLSG